MKIRPRPTGTPWDILLIDSNREDAQALSGILETLGCRISLVNTAIKGQEAAKKTIFDAVFSIITMRRMDAYELAFALHNDPRTARVPVILMSAEDDKPDMETCKQLGIEHVLRKPVKLEAIVGVLTHVLPHQSAPRDDTDTGRHLAHRKLEALGFDVEFASDGTAAGQLTLAHANIQLPNTGERVEQVIVAASTPNDARVVEPRLMMRLPAVPILDFDDSEQFERFVETEWESWLEEQRASLEFLDQMGVTFRADDEVGVMGRTEHDGRVVEFSFRDRRTIILESYGTWSFPKLQPSPPQIIDLHRGVTYSQEELMRALANVLEGRAHDLGALAEAESTDGSITQAAGQREFDEEQFETPVVVEGSSSGPRELAPGDFESSAGPFEEAGPRELEPSDFDSASDKAPRGQANVFAGKDLESSWGETEEQTVIPGEQTFELTDSGVVPDLADDDETQGP